MVQQRVCVFALAPRLLVRFACCFSVGQSVGPSRRASISSKRDDFPEDSEDTCRRNNVPASVRATCVREQIHSASSEETLCLCESSVCWSLLARSVGFLLESGVRTADRFVDAVTSVHQR